MHDSICTCSAVQQAAFTGDYHQMTAKQTWLNYIHRASSRANWEQSIPFTKQDSNKDNSGGPECQWAMNVWKVLL